MPAGRRRLATALVMLMILAPFASAGMASWNTTNTINPGGDEVTVVGYRVPGNGTIQDGWIHVTNSDVSSALDSTLVLEGTDLLSGGFDNLVYDEDLEAVMMRDDGTRSNISDFAAGDITATLSNQYKSGPGYTTVYASNSVSYSSGCNNSSGVEFEYGFDNNYNSALNENEILTTLYYCDVHSSSNGTNTTYSALTSTSVESFGSNCEFGGFEVDSGIDWDDDRALDSSEIDDTIYICHYRAIWGPAILSNMNGTLQGANRVTSYGTIPSIAQEGAVTAATLPGEAVPAGTDAWLIAPKFLVPSSAHMSGYWMTFDHWYHVDSTANGEGDGVWVEYRIKNGTWTSWSWIAPDGGYPSTLSEDGPDVTGAPSSGALPVFASPTASGWVTSNVSLSSIPEIHNADEVQFRFRIWTSPNATDERPGWFLDNIEYNNDGIDYGVWHHGCIATTGTCQYSGSAYGGLQRSVDLSGTDGDSWIEIDMEWDLQGSLNDNACVELSLNNNTWTDISSTGTTATTTNCEDRTGAIPGYGYTTADGDTYLDDSFDYRTINLSIPSSYQNQSNVEMRIIVDTDLYTHYGGSCCGDSREGLTVKEFRVYTDDDTVIFEDDFFTSTTMSDYIATPPSGTGSANDWAHYVLATGDIYESLGFEDSGANAPTVSDADGWSRNPTSGSNANKWSLGQLGSQAGPSTMEPSFPYVYGVNLNGNYGNQADAYLTSPSYEIPANSSATLTFEKWVCTENYWDAIGLYIKVNNGAWQYFDPGITGWYDGSVGYSGNGMYGNDAWMGGDCGQTEFENRQASLSQYAGDTVKFRFRIYTDFSVTYQGGYVDDFGILIPNYSAGGSWTSPPIDLTSVDEFNLGWLDIDALVPTNTSITGTLIDTSTGAVVNGLEDVAFPISLAGVDSALHDSVKVEVNLDSLDPEASPRIKKISLGGKRFLSADSFDTNGWDMSPSVEVVDGLLNATTISGTITSDYIHSSRPIKSIDVSGNTSSGISVTAYDENGNQIGTSGAGGVGFTYPVTGFSLSIALPTNGWIDRMVMTAEFAEPAKNPSLDVLDDDSTEWSFPMGDDYGHYGWQSLISGDSEVVSSTLDLDGTNPASVTVRIPTSASLYGGIITIASQSADGFAAAVSVSVEGASQSSGSENYVFYNTLNVAQLGAIAAQGTSHTDYDTGREWRDINIEVDSNSAQTVSLSRLGIGYLLFENVSGLGPSVAAYHDAQTTDDPPPELVNIPVSISAEAGILTVDGDLKFDYIITNRDFQVPNTFYPRGTPYSITTKHHHLHDNTQLSEITLRGQASDGQVIEFVAYNGADGLWGAGADSVTLSQVRGDSVLVLNTSATTITESVHNDGYTDITVAWVFDISWNWDDVESIRWVAKALDSAGETVWPAVSHSGQSGRKAVENDLQVDTFEVRDQFGRLLSNQYSTFYPYPIIEGSILNITGNVRFQDSTDNRPIGDDFQVRLNLSGSLIMLDSADGGEFSGIVNTPSSTGDVTASPELFRVGPLGGAIGALDVSGVATVVTIRQDSNPPIAGQIEVNTPTGLTRAHGKVWDPTVPLSMFVTIQEAEARGETLTLHYWRADVDDLNGDGIADVDEYLSQTQPLSSGMTGEQQVNFAGIDASGQSFNSPVHVYLEGTDWAGLTYQDGGTGGGPGADDAWATIIIATDEPTTLVNGGFALDRETGYLLAGVPHTFRMQINEPNGLHTLDNVSVMLCGDRIDNLGKFTYNPSNGEIWTADDSMVSPLTVQTQQITSAVVELAMMFQLSWQFPWEDGQYGCKPGVSIMDDITEVAYQNNIGELTWELDNSLSAIPSEMVDITPPVVEPQDLHLYLRQGDELELSGEIYYSGSGVVMTTIPDDLEVEMKIIYGTQEIKSVAEVNEDGTWVTSMTLPMRVPLNPTMGLTTSVLNLPGQGVSTINEDAQVTVDSISPTVLFDQTNYPDSSLTTLESDLLEEVLVTVTIIDEIGMSDDDLEVAWVFLRNNLPVAGTEDIGALSLIIDDDGRDIFQGKLDFTPALEGFEVANGDRILFWVTSTDRAGNEIQGLGSDDTPRTVALRIMQFVPSLDNVVVTPKDPYPDTTVTIETFWSNSGKRDGTIEINLYELTGDSKWRSESNTIDLDLPAETSSVYARFEWIAGDPGQPVLYIIVDDDFDNPAHAIPGILVQQVITEDAGDDEMMTWVIIGGVFLVAVAMVGFFVNRSRSEDDEYYYEDDEDSYYEEDWEYEDEESDGEDADEASDADEAEDEDADEASDADEAEDEDSDEASDDDSDEE